MTTPTATSSELLTGYLMHDPRLGKVRVLLPLGRKVAKAGPTVPKSLANCIDGRVKVELRDLLHGAEADFYIVPSLNAKREMNAAEAGAIPVCLPAASNWLALQVARRAVAGQLTTIIVGGA